MARSTAYTIYHESPPKMGMTVDEGAWTDDDDYKLGGYFATATDKDTFVKLDTTYDATVLKAGSGETPVGKLISEPMGLHTRRGRQGTVLLFGVAVIEVEPATGSAAITPGSWMEYSTSGGTFGEGVWTKTTKTTSCIALANWATASGAGCRVPVLIGAQDFI